MSTAAELAAKYGNLPKDTDGRALVTLMLDPRMQDADGRPVGYLSLVDRGANGRTIAVAKRDAPADLPETAFLLPDVLQRRFPVRKADGSVDAQGVAYAMTVLPEAGLPEADLEAATVAVKAMWGEVVNSYGAVPAGAADALRGMLGPFISIGAITEIREDGTIVVSKRVDWAYGTTDFDAAVAVRDVRARFEAAMGAFSEVFWNVMYDSEVEDPESLLNQALGTFSTHVSSIFTAIPVAKRGDVAVEIARKAGRAISRTNRDRLRKIEEALVGAGTSLKELLDIAGEDPDQEDDVDQKAIKAAVDAAIAGAKAAGITDPTALSEVASKAAVEIVSKIAGPPQPAIHQNLLAMQFGEIPGFNTAGKTPEEIIKAAVGQVWNLTKKIELLEALVSGTPVTKGADGKEVPGAFGIVDVVSKHSEALEKVGEIIAADRSTPRPPAAGDGSPVRKRYGGGDDPLRGMFQFPKVTGKP